MTWIFDLFILAIFCFFAPLGLANTYAVAERQYRAGDLINAEKSVLGYLKQPNAAVVQSESLRLLGVIRYSKGDTLGAERSFKEGLSINPKLKINQRDVLDVGVIILFEKVRGRILQANGRTSNPIPDTNLVSGNSLKTASRSMRTTIRILANLNGGKVMIDGIYAGDTGYALSVDPGNISFEVMAPGYRTYKGVARVLTRNETVVKVTMQKLPTRSARVVGTSVGGTQARVAGRSPIYRSGSKVYGNTQIDDNKPISETSSNVRRDKTVTKVHGPKDELFGEPISYQSKANIQMSAPLNDFDRDLAEVKKRDAAKKLAKNQQRLRSRPPAEFFLSPSEQNVIAATHYSSANRPQPHRTSVISGQEPQSNSNLDATIVGSEDSRGFFTPQSRQNQIAKNSVNITDANIESIPDPAYKPSSESSQSNLMTIFPLGLGQLVQSRYGFGSFLFVIQSSLLVYAFDKSNQADNQEDGLQRFVDLNCSASDVTDERLRSCVNVVDKEYNKVDSLRNQSNYALAGFAVVALGGIIEAMNWEPPRKLLKTPSANGAGKHPKTLGIMDSSLNAEDQLGLRLGFTMPTSLQGPLGLGLGLGIKYNF